MLVNFPHRFTTPQEIIFNFYIKKNPKLTIDEKPRWFLKLARGNHKYFLRKLLTEGYFQ